MASDLNQTTPDIIERLREADADDPTPPHISLLEEAAREIASLRLAIKTALGFYQVTHIHAALREAINGE